MALNKILREVEQNEIERESQITDLQVGRRGGFIVEKASSYVMVEQPSPNKFRKFSTIGMSNIIKEKIRGDLDGHILEDINRIVEE